MLQVILSRKTHFKLILGKTIEVLKDNCKGPFTLINSESEKDQRTIRKDQSVSCKISKKMFIFAIAQCKWAPIADFFKCFQEKGFGLVFQLRDFTEEEIEEKIKTVVGDNSFR